MSTQCSYDNVIEDHEIKKKSIKMILIGIAYQGKDIVFRFIIEYSRFIKGFWLLGSGSSFIWGFLKDDILACVKTWD